MVLMLKNQSACLQQRDNHGVRIIGALFPISVVNEKRITAGSFASGNIAPSISYHEAMRKIYLPLVRSVYEHSWFWLTASTSIRARVETSLDIITQSISKQLAVHRLHNVPLLDACRDIWLVCDDNDQETSLTQIQHRVFSAWEKYKLF